MQPQSTTLGATGLSCSRIGLGGGGHSRLGTRHGGAKDDAVALVCRAIELGITLIDTAESYGTESVIGEALRRVGRDGLVVCTKASIEDWSAKAVEGEQQPLRRKQAFAEAIDASLTKLGVETIDVFQLHALSVQRIQVACEVYVPILEEARRAGKIRFIGVTEAFDPDPSHEMLDAALSLDAQPFEIAMIGHNALNQSAEQSVLPGCVEQGVGTMAMFAVRKALSNPDHLRAVVSELLERGEVDAAAVNMVDPLGFMIDAGEGDTPQTRLVDAAYRFCRDSSGMDVILSGTGNVAHLEANVASMSRPPLPDEVIERCRAIFGSVASVSGN